MSPRRFLPLAACALIVLVLAGGALACPNCKDAVQPDEGAAAGFNNAILFALASVFGIAGTLVFKVVRAVRRAERLEG